MAFYPHPHQFPIYMNAYPMPFPNQEFYPVYPPHPHPGSGHGGHHGGHHGDSDDPLGWLRDSIPGISQKGPLSLVKWLLLFCHKLGWLP